MLIYLITDYTRNAELRERFRANPELVFDWYEISQEDRDALRAEGLEELARRARRELDTLLSHESWSGSYGDLWSEQGYLWTWEHTRTDFRFTPDEGRVGVRLTVTLFARESVLFQEGATVEFRTRGESVPAFEARVDEQGRRLQAMVEFETPGTYYIVVRQPDGRPLSSNQPFTVTRR